MQQAFEGQIPQNYHTCHAFDTSVLFDLLPKKGVPFNDPSQKVPVNLKDLRKGIDRDQGSLMCKWNPVPEDAEV